MNANVQMCAHEKNDWFFKEEEATTVFSIQLSFWFYKNSIFPFIPLYVMFKFNLVTFH